MGHTLADRHQNCARSRAHKRAFTLVELLVALAVFFLLLTVMLVPIRLAFDTLNIGRARSEAQQAAQATMNQLDTDLKRAIFVYPNARLIGLTDGPGYNGNNKRPYTRYDGGGALDTIGYPCGVASNDAEPWDNTARLDLVLPRTRNGAVVNPVQAGDIVVTYYARRLDMSLPFDIVDNPIVLYRAQIPFRDSDSGTDTMFDDDAGAGDPNVDLRASRFTSASCTAAKERRSLWISHNGYGEANLEDLTDTDAKAENAGNPTVFAAHSLATPRGMALVAPRANTNEKLAYVPDSSFICEDTNSDGKIDRVTANLIMANYAASNAVSSNGQARGQVVRLNRVIDLPNIQ